MKRLSSLFGVCALALTLSASAASSLPIEVHRHPHHRHAKKHTVPVVSRVNLNTGTRVELTRLPGIDGATADKIIAGRPWGSGDEMVARGVLTHEQYEKIRLRISTKVETD